MKRKKSKRPILQALLWVLMAAIVLFVALLIGFWVLAGQRETKNIDEAMPNSGALTSTSDGKIFLLIKGQKGDPVVLFAHGTAAWSGLWEPTLNAVAQNGYQAVAFDMPPFGFSEYAVDGDYSRTRQAERVIALLETFDTPPIIVAHSVGAGPMVEATMKRPDLVSGLVVVAGAIALNSHETPATVPLFLRNRWITDALVSATATNPLLTSRFLSSFVFNKAAVTPEIVSVLQRPLTRLGYTAAVAKWVPQLFLSPVNADSTREDSWRLVDIPTVFIWGEKDTITPLDQGRALHALVPNSKLIILPNVGHIPQIEDPAGFQAALFDALLTIAE